MAAALLDTTVLIDVLRGRPETVRRLRSLHAAGDVPCICAINVEELWRGARDGEAEALEAIAAGCRMLALGADEGRRAGGWRSSFAARGVTLSQADCLIAAAAASHGARLCTDNVRHFPMSGIDVEHWPSGL